MKTKVFIGSVLFISGCLLLVAFVPGLSESLTGSAERPVRPTVALAGFGLAEKQDPAPPPAPPSEQEEAQKKLGWLSVPATPDSLFSAAADREYFVAGLLLKAGIAPDLFNEEGFTPLMVAIREKDERMVDLLLEHRADVNARGKTQVSPLEMAAEAGNLELTRKLLKRGADVDVTNADGETLLLRMVAAGNAEVCELLLNAGADATNGGPGGAVPLETALRKGHSGIARTLFELETAPRMAWTPFMKEMLTQALVVGNREMADLLISNHPGIPKPEGATQSLLAYTLAWGNLSAFQTLLDCGADPNEPLSIPAEEQFIDVVNDDTLIYYLQKEQGMTVLMLAAGLGRLEFVDALLEKGADRLARTGNHKMVPISFAQRNNHTRTILRLLGKNPDPATHKMRVAISLSGQKAVLYKNGVAVFRTPVSTGRAKYRTPAGDYVVTDKHRSRVSSIYDVEMPYFMRLNGSGYGMHEGHVPGYPASHGCIRLPRSAAKKLFSEVDVGTYVTISE